MRIIPSSALKIYEVANDYWQDIADVINNRINPKGSTFYSRDFDLLRFEDSVIRIKEEKRQMLKNGSDTIASFYNERYKLLMRYGDGTTPMSGELYVLFRNQLSEARCVGYLKCYNGTINVRKLAPSDPAGEILFNSLYMSLPGPISYMISKISEHEVEVLKVLR